VCLFAHIYKYALQITPVSGSSDFCSKIISDILVLPEFIYFTFKTVYIATLLLYVATFNYRNHVSVQVGACVLLSTCSVIEALRNALYKLKTYLLIIA